MVPERKVRNGMEWILKKQQRKAGHGLAAGIPQF